MPTSGARGRILPLFLLGIALPSGLLGYLALRGIRTHDHRTYKDRTLTREEKRAIDAVQAVAAAPSNPQPK